MEASGTRRFTTKSENNTHWTALEMLKKLHSSRKVVMMASLLFFKKPVKKLQILASQTIPFRRRRASPNDGEVDDEIKVLTSAMRKVEKKFY